MKQRSHTYLSWFVLAAIVLVGWRFIDWHTVWNTLLHVQPVYLCVCVAVYFAGIWLSCLRWKWLLITQGIQPSLRQLARWYVIGALAGSVLPSDVGGDLGRAYLAARAFDNKAAAWSSVIGERLAGLTAMLVLSAVTLLMAPTLLGWSASVPIGVLSTGLVVAVLGSASLQSNALAGAWVPSRVRHTLDTLRTTWNRYQSRPGALLACLGVSLIYHMLNSFSLWMLVLAVVPQGASWRVGLVMPLIGLVGVLPITPGGLGVREGTFALLLARSGIGLEHAVAAALLSRVLVFLCTLTGLPLLLKELRVHATESSANN